MSDNFPPLLGWFRRPTRAFTLIETMVAIACMSILMVPIVWVYRSGSRTALEGLVKAEITVEARTILRQIHDDLKYSVFVFDYSKPPSSQPTFYFNVALGGDNETSYSLLRFSLHGAVGESIESAGSVTAFRTPMGISYELKKEDQSLFSLYRKEGGKTPALLSKRVNFFEIREHTLAPAKTAWLVTLQLAEIVKPLSGDASFLKLQTSQDLSVKALERRLLDRTRGVQIADFYDVVASEYYSVFRKTLFIPNWQTLLKRP